MSPVHVIVGDDPRAEQMWASSFTGAVDLYRFDRNVDAFERLTAAQAPIDLVVLTPAQRGPFNLTPDQFVARVLEGPLGSSSTLANLHVIVVGQQLARSHPRAMSVSTLEAAIRLVKFGEVERAPRPATLPVPSAPSVQPTSPSRGSGIGDVLAGEFSGSIISSIWNAGADERHDEHTPDERDPGVIGGGPSAPTQRPAPELDPVVVPTAAAPAPLFSRVAPPGFVAVGAAAAANQPIPRPDLSVAGGGHALPTVGAPGEAIEVATGLQPARGYHLEGGGTYRGPALRNGVPHMASHDVGGQPVPPALASQVQSMVYGANVQVGSPHDPLMVWSSGARDGAPVPVPQVPQVPQAVPAQPTPPAAQVVAPVAAPVRTVPMEPPAGAYGQPAQPAPPRDPFLARAEAGGGDVAFG